MMTLARATCPRCGIVVVAASPAARDVLCRAHDAEVHGLAPVEPAPPSPSAIAPAPRPIAAKNPEMPFKVQP